MKRFVLITLLLSLFTAYNSKAQNALFVNNYTNCNYAIAAIANDACDYAYSNPPCFVPANSVGNICITFTTAGVWYDGFGNTPMAFIPSWWTWHAIRIINLNNNQGTMVGTGSAVPSCTPASYPALNAYPVSSTAISCGGSTVTITWNPGPGAGNVTIDIF